MPSDAANVERRLLRDLDQLGERLVDESFCSDLYRALASNRWSRQEDPELAVALSWTRAERLVNDLRERRGEQPLTLAQTGGEGELGGTVAAELDRLGWQARPLDTSREDPSHSGEPSDSPPPAGKGEEESPVEDARGWEREAHREARSGAAPDSGTTAGGDRQVRSDKP